MQNSAQNDVKSAHKQSINIDQDVFTLEVILERIGQFGKFQLLIFLMICIPMMFKAISSTSFVFTAGRIAYRCNITECDTASSTYNEVWTQWTIPKENGELSPCHRYEAYLTENTTSLQSYKQNLCYPDNFNADVTYNCPENDFKFLNKEVTISKEFSIYCADEWKLSLVGTLSNVGQFVGIPLGGIISDRYGRSRYLALGGVIGSVLGLIRSFSPNYGFFIAFEVLDNIASSSLYSTCFIVGIELVGPKRRVMACSLITIFYAIGEAVLAVIAKYYQNWRLLLRIVYIPGLIQVLYIWLLPESVRWLLSQGEDHRAKNILKRAAVCNGRRLSDNSLDKLIMANQLKLDIHQNDNKFPVKNAFKLFFWRIANCSLCWVVNSLVYYGLMMNAVTLDGNKYNNFIFSALIEIPGLFLPFLTIDNLGRKYSLFAYMIISGLSCLGTVFISPTKFYWQLSLFLIGRMTIAASYQVLYFYTSEIFPTNLRNSLLSFCSMIGRIGSMLAPQVPLLAKYYSKAPAILFATTAIFSGCLTLLFPETADTILPATMEEADNIGKKSKNVEDNESSMSTHF